MHGQTPQHYMCIYLLWQAVQKYCLTVHLPLQDVSNGAQTHEPTKT
jgi:hypothetical protein